MTTHALGSRDLWLAGVAAVVGAVALTAALRQGQVSEMSTTPMVASVKQAVGDIKMRLALTLGWRGASRGTEVHDGDALFVPPGAEATLLFGDGSELAIDERSLVVVERPHSGARSVILRQGSMSGRAGTEGLVLQTPAGEAQLEAQSEARVEIQDGRVEVSVKKGTAKVRGAGGAAKTVGSGQRVAAARVGIPVELAPFAVRLQAPEAQARLAFRGKPAPVTLAWEGNVGEEAQVQVARDRLFAFVDAEFPAHDINSLVLQSPSKGVTWWRVVDADKRPLSEARRFTYSEDIAPVAMFPRNGEVLLARPGSSVSFTWTPLAGIGRYRVEISPSQSFEPLTVSAVANGASTRLVLSLEESMWFWRVRVDDEAGLGLPSEPMRFRIIHKGIPEAPELLSPEVEVTP